MLKSPKLLKLLKAVKVLAVTDIASMQKQLPSLKVTTCSERKPAY